jgi:cellulose synthase/poly-beta-1,6-N-acetylglucosamine synthase-like glycosyltransferase
MADLVAVVYTMGFAFLGLYGLKALVVTLAYLHVRRRADEAPPLADHPFVTVQLPVYNERAVAARVVDAACALRWPRDRFEVQVLDDSTDETREVVDSAVRAWQSRGIAIAALRRADRGGFKAGALAHGLRRARGTVVAVFDADFVPAPDFLEQVVPFLAADVAVVQTRWGHLNADASGLTRAQALALDGHFIVEQTARARYGLFLNFNGTGGVWRREAIDAVGGWHGDTLSEDVDLSYRVQLAGWRIRFLPAVVVPGELPTTVLAFKRQQRRWAMGTTQVLRKHGRAVWRSDRPLSVRLHAVLSLATHLVHPISLLLFLGAPLMLVYHPALHSALGVLTLVALCPPLMYAVAAARLHADWPRRLTVYPLLVALTLGMSLSGTVAVVEALAGRRAVFERTPKGGDAAPAAGYAQRPDRWALVEGLLAVYAWLGFGTAVWRGMNGLAMFFALFAAGFSLVGWLSLRPWMVRRISPALPPVPAGER